MKIAGMGRVLVMLVVGVTACNNGQVKASYSDPYGEWVVTDLSAQHISDGVSDAASKTIGKTIVLRPQSIEAAYLAGQSVSCTMTKVVLEKATIYRSDMLSPSAKNYYECGQCGFGDNVVIMRAEAKFLSLWEVVFDEGFQRMFIDVGGVGFICKRVK